jgi:hypothetical protein
VQEEQRANYCPKHISTVYAHYKHQSSMSYVLNHKISGTITIAAGAGQANLEFHPEHETCVLLAFSPQTSSTTYNVSIHDEDRSFLIYNREDVEGDFAEQVELPFTGDYSIRIDTASEDEPIDYYLTNKYRS